MVFILVFIFQMIFNVAKVYEVKYSYENKLKPLLLSGGVLSLLTVLSTFLSVDLLLDGDWRIIIVFVGGSLMGKYIAYKLNTTKYRNKVFNLLKKRYD
jgi:hypothetical protein